MIGWHQLESMRLLTGFICLHAEDLLECTIKVLYRPRAPIVIISICTCTSSCESALMAKFAAVTGLAS